MEEKENYWVEGKTKAENQGGEESPFALLAQAYWIFISHYIETNERAITIPSQMEEKENHGW